MNLFSARTWKLRMDPTYKLCVALWCFHASGVKRLYSNRKTEER